MIPFAKQGGGEVNRSSPSAGLLNMQIHLHILPNSAHPFPYGPMGFTHYPQSYPHTVCFQLCTKC